MNSAFVLSLIILKFILFTDTYITDEVERLRLEYPENELLLQRLQNESYEIINPIQMRQHLKLGISTKYTSLNTSEKHYQQTTLLIKAFNYDFRLELELNKYLLSPNLLYKTYLPDGVVHLAQSLENCYYHATIKDYPDAVAALRTCDGISGIIYLQNDTLAIHPFYGGDLSIKHPHIIYHLPPESDTVQLCDINGIKEDITNDTVDDNSTDIARTRRNIQELIKYIEVAIVIDKAMLSMKNGIHSAVIGDIIQSVNYVDLFYKKLNTRLSIVYVETWNDKDHIEIKSPLQNILDNFINYATEKLTSVNKDIMFFITGYETQEEKLGIGIPKSICTEQSAIILQGRTETHILAGTMAHILGHTLGINHDTEDCICEDWWRGCIMEETLTNSTRSHFSSCNLEIYLNILQNNKAICLFNKPYPLENIPFCGNGIIETDEDCDCGSIQDCLDNEPCCDPITCKLKHGAECSLGECCHNCKLKPKGHLCRKSVSECDIPEYCDGINGKCPKDIYQKNGKLCGDGENYCYLGTCPSPRSLCVHIWGYNAYPADDICFDRLNVQGGLGGHCGRDGQGGYKKCLPENVKCGALHCKKGLYNRPLMEPDTEFTSAIFTNNGSTSKCKLMQGNESTDIWTMVPEGSKCGENKVCINGICTKLDSVIDKCPSDNNYTCSGHGICSTIDTCYCEEGWTYFDCSVQIDSEKIPVQLNIDNSRSWLKKLTVQITNYGFDDSLDTPQPILIITLIVIIAMFVFLIVIYFGCKQQQNNSLKEQDTESITPVNNL